VKSGLDCGTLRRNDDSIAKQGIDDSSLRPRVRNLAAPHIE